ncbi:YSIRK-type signal peptide-containing protein [Gemella sp. 27098_8_92]|uniref:MucBP domain-containing protein n=1 Tax=Gemella sp. 27098_8_92 TaxID=3003687 RepID=UPI00352C20AD
MRNMLKQKELFSIRKISVGVASVMIGASMLGGVQPLGKMEVQAKDKIEAEATQDVQVKVVEHEGGALLEITATKDISNVDMKITLDGQKVTTYHIDKLKAGKSITKELTKAQLDKVKEALAKKIKTLPNTAVVRKNVEKILNIDNSILKVAVSYDVEEGTMVPNKPEVKPGNSDTKPGKPDTKPGDSTKPGKPDTKPEGPSNQALRTKLEELVKRELRTEAGYIANQGNQIANNAWINAKTEAEKVLKNDLATKEELEEAIKNLEEKIHDATLGSEKVKVEKLIRAKNRLDLIPKLRKAKTLGEVLKLKELVKPEIEKIPETPNKPEEKPGKPEGTPETTPEKPGNNENGNNPLPSAKPIINSYSFDNKVIESAGGEVNVTLKGENLTAENVKIKVLNPFTAAKEEELSNSIIYKKVGDDVIATIKLPANTTSVAKSFNLVFTDALGMKVITKYTEERGENGRVITVLPVGKTKQDSVLSFVTISSYQAHHSTDLTTTTTDKGNVSKKTVAHLYGTNLKANVTKVKIIDQNGVEWPIHTTGSNIEASDYPMMVIGKLGNGISGNGTYQEVEIVLPNNLDTDMTFTYVFAPDGVNFDETHKVTAVVEKTTNVKPVVKRTITVKYQDENGKALKDNKVLTGYSWFNYNVEKDTIDGYKNIIVKDNKALSGKFGNKDQEITLVYTNKDVVQPSETEKPAPQEDTLVTSKAKLKELIDRDLKLEDSYKKASAELQTNWRRARALANRVLAESKNKEEVDSQIIALKKVIAAIENPTEASKPSEEKPKEEGNAGNTTKPTKSVDELKTELQKLVEQDPTKEDNYKLKDSLQEKAWKTARAKAQALLQGEATAEVLEEQVGKLTRALETLKEENKLANNKPEKPNTTPELPAPEEKVPEVTSYTGDKTIISKEDGKLVVMIKGKNLKASDLSFRFHDGNSWKDVTLKVISEDSNKIVLEFVVPEELRNSTATYKISAKYKNQTIKANGAINFKIA